jgi:hypothetical protein
MMLVWSLNSERRQNDTTSFKLQINLVPCSVAWKVIELYFNFPYLGLLTWQERKYHLSTRGVMACMRSILNLSIT